MVRKEMLIGTLLNEDLKVIRREFPNTCYALKHNNINVLDSDDFWHNDVQEINIDDCCIKITTYSFEYDESRVEKYYLQDLDLYKTTYHITTDTVLMK